jgi:hypothetical protein
MEGGEAMQVTKYKYRASNLNGLLMVVKYFFLHSLKDLLRDSILNPTKSIPTWKMEKPGFENEACVIANKAKPIKRNFIRN